MKNKNKQIKKEALWTMGLYIFYFLWWYFFAYSFGEKDVKEYQYIFGLPEWFFYSCVLGLVIMNFLVFIVIRFFFREISLEEEENRK